MKPDLKIMLFLTFLTGLLAGSALYITVFAPMYDESNVEERSEFAVVGEAYGGCRSNCRSFRLEENRSYQMIEGEDRTEGYLPRWLFNDVYDAVADAPLSFYAEPVDKTDCVSFVDGVDLSYDITSLGERYRLDTCKTNYDRDTELEATLTLLWMYFDDPDSVKEDKPYEEFDSWFVNWFGPQD